MRSTFMGLETSKRAMFTQQSALYTVGHNIGNANTLGYSRQRVNMETTTPFPAIGLHSGTMPGFIGTGVQASSIQRIRDVFVDRQYRLETNNFGYWESRATALSQMEDILQEPSEHGLSASLNKLWADLEGVSKDAENAGARRVAVESGVAAAESFNYLHKQLSEVQGGLRSELVVSTDSINAIFEQLANLNKQIMKVEPNGYLPNDLYDARDVLLDELSTYFPIEIEYTKSGGNALAFADGAVTVRIKTDAGSIEVINGDEFAKMSTSFTGNGPAEHFDKFTFSGDGVTGGTITQGNMLQGKGEMLSLVNSYGYDVGQGLKGVYPEMLKNLDDMAIAFAEEFNRIHNLGFEFDSDVNGDDFFVFTGAGDIRVNSDITDDPNKLAVSSRADEEGNGENALLLANMQSGMLTIGGTNATIESFHQSIIGKLGVDANQANTQTKNSGILLATVENRRMSISSVSEDEEMTDMIKFQHGYNASARMITVVDEMLDRIINGMGRVGQ